MQTFLYIVLCLSSTIYVNAFFQQPANRRTSLTLQMKGTSRNVFVDTLVAACLMLPLSNVAPVHAIAQQYKLPPIDRADTNRCNLQSSSIGQANAARDKLYDLRECDLKGQDASGKDQSGMIASQADFSGVSFKEGQVRMSSQTQPSLPCTHPNKS